jgi:ABC-2 type transport system ATP-binding protein
MSEIFESKSDEIISVENLTKDYGHGRGVFDVNLTIKKGECLGLVGANGAGKTTLIRSIMGFIKPTGGNVSIHGLDSWNDAEKAKRYIGYVPGEIAFPDIGSGTAFIKSQAELLGLADLTYAKELVRILQIDLSADLKRMSKGMKQKSALVEALMNNAEILIMDEPSTGLDPLMRVSFIDVIQAERKKGKTILMSSHLYEEVEQLCDRVAFLYNGQIEEIVEVNKIINPPDAEYKIEFTNKNDYNRFKRMGYKIIRDQQEYYQVTVEIAKSATKQLFDSLKAFKLKFLTENTYTLERHFKQTLSKYRKEIKL